MRRERRRRELFHLTPERMLAADALSSPSSIMRPAFCLLSESISEFRAFTARLARLALLLVPRWMLLVLFVLAR